MTTINTALTFDSNDKARLKLYVIELLEKTNWKTVSLAFPGVSRASAFRWKKRYLKSGKKLTSLLPISTKSHKTREMYIPSTILGFIKELRIKYSRLSKYKIKVFLLEILNTINYPIHTIQTDNGSEFKGYFDKAIEDLKETRHL